MLRHAAFICASVICRRAADDAFALYMRATFTQRNVFALTLI